jgi:hypothetical protein
LNESDQLQMRNTPTGKAVSRIYDAGGSYGKRQTAKRSEEKRQESSGCRQEKTDNRSSAEIHSNGFR